jgi:signal peptidase I
MSQNLLPKVSLQDGLRRLGGFFLGLLILLAFGWGLIGLAYYYLAPKFGVTSMTAALIAAAISLVVIQLLERNHGLTRMMGFELVNSIPAWMSATLVWLFGPLFVLYQVGNYGQESFTQKVLGAAPAQPKLNPAPAPQQRDHIREAVESLVFVISLVLMLKTFVVEAFVIPTGSMAETLYGYKKIIICPECDHEFAVNASREVEPSPGNAANLTTGFCCPNCRFSDPYGAFEKNRRNGQPELDARSNRPVPKFGWTSGDRVLVGKFMSTTDRGRVVVFKFPDAPQTGQVAQNYIKRLVGLPGETIAIFNGDLYTTTSLKYDPGEKDELGNPKYPRPERDTDLWRAPFSDQYSSRWNGPDYRYPNTEAATTLFKTGQATSFADPAGFQILRKPDDLVMEMRRLVYDNDHQSRSLTKLGAAPRWFTGTEAAGWRMDDTKAPLVFTHIGEQIGWVRYQHLLPTGSKDDSNPGWTTPTTALEPRRITNFMGFNAGYENTQQGNLVNSNEWCGDLMLECDANIENPSAKVVLELSKGPNRFQAEFADGKVKLIRTGPGGGELTTCDTPLTSAGRYALRFANVDCRLRVWVNGTALNLGAAADYSPPPPPPGNKEVWTANDLEQPASVGATGAVAVSGLKIWRDTHYTNQLGTLDTYFVQPGHYLCMGDNSSQSSDGRMWGLVPERLMLGRAVFVFFPLQRFGFIR